ncbi:MAG: protein kinase [Candidatus Kerfeldbacteria bacterium]
MPRMEGQGPKRVVPTNVPEPTAQLRPQQIPDAELAVLKGALDENQGDETRVEQPEKAAAETRERAHRLLDSLQALVRFRKEDIVTHGLEDRGVLQRMKESFARLADTVRGRETELRTLSEMAELIPGYRTEVESADEAYLQDQLVPKLNELLNTAVERTGLARGKDLAEVRLKWSRSLEELPVEGPAEEAVRKLDGELDAIVGYDEAVRDEAEADVDEMELDLEEGEEAEEGELDMGEEREDIIRGKEFEIIKRLFDNSDTEALTDVEEYVFSTKRAEYTVDDVFGFGGYGIASIVNSEKHGRELMKITKPSKRSESLDRGSVEAVYSRSQDLELAAMNILTRKPKREAEKRGKAFEEPPVAELRDAIYYTEGDERSLALTMELVEGKDLIKAFKKEPTIEKAFDLSGQLVSAVQYMHERGVYHRDLKPANMIVREEDGKLKVIDFGTAIIPRLIEKQKSRLDSSALLRGDKTLRVAGGVREPKVKRPEGKQPSSEPVTFALPIEGIYQGSPNYVPNFETSGDTASLMKRLATSLEANPAESAKWMQYFAEQRDYYAVGMMMYDMYEQLVRKASELSDEDRDRMEVLGHIATSVIEENEKGSLVRLLRYYVEGGAKNPEPPKNDMRWYTIARIKDALGKIDDPVMREHVTSQRMIDNRYAVIEYIAKRRAKAEEHYSQARSEEAERAGAQ